jgi:predicted small secreted protein
MKAEGSGVKYIFNLRKEKEMKTCNCLCTNIGSDGHLRLSNEQLVDKRGKENKKFMKVRIIVVVVTLLALLTSAFCLTGCNTWKGAGKDIEKTGEAMQGSDKN